MTLFELTEEQQAIESMLYQNDGEMTPELEQLLETNKENLTAKADSINMVLHHLEAQSDYLDKEIKRLQALKKSADNSTRRLKERVLYIMDLFNIEKIEGTTFKMFQRNTQSLEVDEATLLFEYMDRAQALKETLPSYVTLDLKVAKSEIKSMYKNTGVLPAGCTMVPNKSLTIK